MGSERAFWRREQCDRAWQIRALHEGRLGEKDAAAFERHLPNCDFCTRMRARDAHLRGLLQSIPTLDASESDLRRLRARVLRDVELDTPKSTSPLRRSALALVALLAVAIIVSELAWMRGR
jgi:anti-sigma factor RsiW